MDLSKSFPSLQKCVLFCLGSKCLKSGPWLQTTFLFLFPIFTHSRVLLAFTSFCFDIWLKLVSNSYAEATRAATAAAKAEYEKRQAAARRGGRSAAPVTPLAELPLVTFLNEEGKVADVSQADAKASVYAVLDEEKKVRYVGISRGVSPPYMRKRASTDGQIAS